MALDLLQERTNEFEMFFVFPPFPNSLQSGISAQMFFTIGASMFNILTLGHATRDQATAEPTSAHGKGKKWLEIGDHFPLEFARNLPNQNQCSRQKPSEQARRCIRLGHARHVTIGTLHLHGIGTEALLDDHRSGGSSDCRGGKNRIDKSRVVNGFGGGPSWTSS